MPLPAAKTVAAFRLPNGKLLTARGLSGMGELTIDNGGSSDAVVTLSKHKKATASVYVRKGKSYTVTGVPNGTYEVFVTDGADWDRKARAFGRKCAFWRFEDPVKFGIKRVGNETIYDTWSFTLQPVVDGTAATADVDPNDFPTT